MASTEPVAVGGDFGRLGLQLPGSEPRPAVRTPTTLSQAGRTPKVIEQNDFSSATDWLGERWLEEAQLRKAKSLDEFLCK